MKQFNFNIYLEFIDLHPGNVIYHEYTSDKVTTTRIDKSSPLQSASSDHDWELSFIDAGKFISHSLV